MLAEWQFVCIIIGVCLLGNSIVTNKVEAIQEVLSPFQQILRLFGLAFWIAAAIPELPAIR